LDFTFIVLNHPKLWLVEERFEYNVRSLARACGYVVKQQTTEEAARGLTSFLADLLNLCQRRSKSDEKEDEKTPLVTEKATTMDYRDALLETGCMTVVFGDHDFGKRVCFWC
jgi:hypothetical protein